MLGAFLSLGADRTEFDGDFEGTGEGVFAGFGGYAVTRLAPGVVLDSYAAWERLWSDLEVSDGILSVDSRYQSDATMIGLGVTGEQVLAWGAVRPTLRVDYGRADIGLVGFDAAAYGGSTTITEDLGRVEQLDLRLTPEVLIELGATPGETRLSFAPSLICSRAGGDASSDVCGSGLRIGLDARSEDGSARIALEAGAEDVDGRVMHSFGLDFELSF